MTSDEVENTRGLCWEPEPVPGCTEWGPAEHCNQGKLHTGPADYPEKVQLQNLTLFIILSVSNESKIQTQTLPSLNPQTEVQPAFFIRTFSFDLDNLVGLTHHPSYGPLSSKAW